MTNYLEVKNLSKSFDSFQLHNISFTLPKGYIMGLIRPNGSGKTTTIKLILNMLKRNGGEIKIMGLENIADEQKARSELGVVFDTNYFSAGTYPEILRERRECHKRDSGHQLFCAGG